MSPTPLLSAAPASPPKVGAATPTSSSSATLTPTIIPVTPTLAPPTQTAPAAITPPGAITLTPTEAPLLPTATAAASLVSPGAAIAPGLEIIVDNKDAGFSTTGAWFSGDGGHSYQGDCAWAPRGVGNIAYIQPQLPAAGSYEVFGWWCGDPNHDQAQRAIIEIYPFPGILVPKRVTVDYQENAGQWNILGTYYLETDGSLSIDSNLEGNVVADAFRFVYQSPEQIEITPTPLPTPVIWTNNPPTPLEQLTSGDLSARLGLVQWLYPYTPIITMESLNFDDCQAFPRNSCGGTRSGWRVGVQYQNMLVKYRVSDDYRYVAFEPPAGLAARQSLYLFGSKGSQYFRVEHYFMNDTWQLMGANVEDSTASQMSLDANIASTIHDFANAYSSLTYTTPAGIRLQLYGLGAQVALSAPDEGRMAALAAQLAAAVW